MIITAFPRLGKPFVGVAALSFLTVVAGCASGAQEGSSQGPGAADPGQIIAAGAQVYGNNCARCHNARAAAEKTDLQWDLVVAHMRARANLTGAQARAVRAFLATVNAPPAGGDSEAPEETPEVSDPGDDRFSSWTNLPFQSFPGPLGHRGGPYVSEDPAAWASDYAGFRPQERQEDLVGKGRALAAAKGCIGCHVLEEKGGSIGPSLDDLFERRKGKFVQGKLKNPRVDNPNSVMPDYGLTDEEIAALMAYLQSLAKKDEGQS